mmetsp:Transcript_5502/g.13922  ORF Transcript_5502/g.13922 Transcript_5502/m.13922 type:complete len:265 (-) Transcript_5502:1057-1851(-)
MLLAAQYPTVCSLMYFQCFSCRISVSTPLSVAARYMASAMSSMFHGLTRNAPLSEEEHPTNSDMMRLLQRGSGYPSSVPCAMLAGPWRHVMNSYGIRFMPSRVAVSTAQCATLISAMRSCRLTPRWMSSTTLPPPMAHPTLPFLPWSLNSVTPYVAFRRSAMAATSVMSSVMSRPELRAGLHTCTSTIFSAISGCWLSSSSNACSFSSMPLNTSKSSTPRNTVRPASALRNAPRCSALSLAISPSWMRSVLTPVGQILTLTARP